jgi:hypothetical protein
MFLLASRRFISVAQSLRSVSLLQKKVHYFSGGLRENREVSRENNQIAQGIFVPSKDLK